MCVRVCVVCVVSVCVCLGPCTYIFTTPCPPPCRSVALWSLAKKKPVQYRPHDPASKRGGDMHIGELGLSSDCSALLGPCCFR